MGRCLYVSPEMGIKNNAALLIVTPKTVQRTRVKTLCGAIIMGKRATF